MSAEHVLGTVDGIEIVLRALRCTDERVTVDLYGRAHGPAAEATALTVAIDSADARPYSMPL